MEVYCHALQCTSSTDLKNFLLCFAPAFNSGVAGVGHARRAEPAVRARELERAGDPGHARELRPGKLGETLVDAQGSALRISSTLLGGRDVFFLDLLQPRKCLGRRASVRQVAPMPKPSAAAAGLKVVVGLSVVSGRSARACTYYSVVGTAAS